MYSLCGSRVPLNTPHLKTLLPRSTSTPTLLMFQGHFPVICTYQTFATFWVKRTQKLAAFLNLAPRLINVFSIFFRYQLKLFGSYDRFQISSNTITATGFIRRYVCLEPGCCCTVPLYHQLSSRCRCNCNSYVGWVDPSTDNVI